MRRPTGNHWMALLALALVFAAPGPARAAEVTLRSGRVLQGRIVEQTADAVVMEDADGIRISIPMDKVDRVAQDAPAAPVPSDAAPALVIQSGHTAPVTAVAFSPDGKFLASASSDETVKIWFAETGELFRTLTGHTLTVSGLSFCADGTLVTGSWDATIKVWNPRTGELLRTVGTPLERIGDRDDMVEAVACSPSGRLIAAGDRRGLIVIYDRDTGDGLQELQGFNSDTSGIAFSADETRVAAVEPGGGVAIWKIAPAEVTAVIPRAGGARCLALSPDGTLLAIGGKDTLVEIWNTETGGLVQTLRGHGSDVASMAFGADGNTLLTGDFDGAALLWDLDTGKWTHMLEGHAYGVNGAALSPDGTLAATGSGDGAVMIWSTETGRALHTLRGLGRGVGYAAFSPDGAVFASGGADAKVTIRNSSDGRILKVIEGMPSTVAEFAFSPDGRRLAVKCQDGLRSYPITLWDIESGALIRSLGESMDSIAWSPDGRLLAAGSDYQDVTVWDAGSGALLHTFADHGDVVYAVAFSPDSRVLASGSFAGSVMTWDLKTGERIHSLAGHEGYVYTVAWSPDGKKLATGGGDTRVKIWDASTGRLLHTLDEHKSWVLRAAWSPDAKTLATAAGDMTVRLWDPATGAALKTLEGHFGDVAALAWSPDGAWLLSGGDDSTLRVWDSAAGAARAILIPLNQADWVLVTPEGYFDMTQGARAVIRWRAGARLYAPEQFFDEYYRPGLFQTLARGGSVPQPRDIRAGFAPPPEVAILSPADGADTGAADTVTVRVRIKDAGGGIKRVRLYVNGKLVERALEFKEGSGEFDREFSVSLLPGENRIQATAFSRDHIEARGAEVTVWRPAGESGDQKIFILSVGVSKYKDASMTLTYPDADATRFAEVVEHGARLLFSEVVRTDLLNENATRENITAAMNQIQTRARPQDVVIVFLAGHGITLEDAYFFIPHELVYNADEDIFAQGMSQAEFLDFLAGVSARKTLLVLDTCGSGGLVDAMSTRGMAEKRALALLAKSAGSFLIAASSDTQEALEATGLGHGLLTYALLQALNGLADTSPRDGMITVMELLPFIQQQVPEYAQQHFHHRQYPQVFSNGMDFPLAVE